MFFYNKNQTNQKNFPLIVCYFKKTFLKKGFCKKEV